jgi:hypothetical protein
MSREERRNYERMMRNMERGPTLPPAAKARAERNAARRAARPAPTPSGTFSRRFVLIATLISLAVGYAGFSVQWPNMPFAAYVGVGAALVALAVQVGLRLLQGRVARR